MGGLVGSIFGSKPKTSITQHSTLAPEQQELLSFLSPQLQGRFENVPSTGQFTNAEQLSLDALEQMVTGFATGGGNQQVQDASDTATSFLESIIGQGPRDIDDYFTKTVQEPLLEDFDDILQGTRNRFQSSGNLFSGERREAEARSREDLFDVLGRERTRVAFDERARDINTGMQAAGALPGIAGAGAQFDLAQLAGLSQLATGLGGTERGVAQAQLDEENRRVREILGALGIPAVENVGVSTPGQEGVIPGIISTGASLGLANLFSDRRLKTDIQQIGVHANGLPIYNFRFKSGGPIVTGFMADEVEKIRPEAVSVDPSGYKVVNYALATK